MCFYYEFSLITFLCAFFHLTAFALECPACSSVPGFGINKCDGDKVETITCAADLDRCMTVDLKMTVPNVGSLSLELKNCSNSFVCDPGSDFYSKYNSASQVANRLRYIPRISSGDL